MSTIWKGMLKKLVGLDVSMEGHFEKIGCKPHNVHAVVYAVHNTQYACISVCSVYT